MRCLLEAHGSQLAAFYKPTYLNLVLCIKHSSTGQVRNEEANQRAIFYRRNVLMGRVASKAANALLFIRSAAIPFMRQFDLHSCLFILITTIPPFR
jgi:hypothetical protein